MSYDLMVLDKHKRFKTQEEFLNWYDEQSEGHLDVDGNDYRNAIPSLQSWFLEMKDIVRPMNGEFAPPDDEVDSGEYHEADFCITKYYIHAAFAWSDAERVYPIVKELARKHDVAFFDASGSGDVIYPDGTVLKTLPRVQEDLDTDYMKDFFQKVKEQNDETEYSEEVIQQMLNEQPLAFHPQPSKSAFDKERKRRNWISTGFFMLYTIVFIGVLCLLIQADCFQSFGLYLCIAWLIGAFVLLYFLSEWEYKADEAVRDKFRCGTETNKTKSKEPVVVDDDLIEHYPKPNVELQTIIDRVPSTRLILYYRAMERNINQDWKSWAYEMMEAGYSQPSIVRLAGEDLTINPFEFNALVDSIFKELAVECPDEIAYSQYALGIAHKVMDGDITAERGFAILSDAAIEADYNEMLTQFFYLEDNADLLRNHLPSCYGDGNMTEDNIEEWMALYFKKLIATNE